VKSNLRGSGSIKALLAMALLFSVGAAAQAPTTAPAKSSVLSPAEATAPAGGSANRDTARARPRDVTPHGPTPRLPDGHPDLSGVWNGGGPVGDLAQGLAPGETIPLLPAAKAIMDKRQSKDDPEANCLPTGIPRIAPYPWRIVQTPTHVFFLFEGNIHSYRQIFMDGKHPADPDPSWYGHSIGSWDGDTLVVDTIGFNDKFWFDFRGHPHTEQLHTIERYTRKDLGTLENKVTIIDPGDYAKPFTLTFTARLRPKEELMEYICQENQQDSQHMIGNSGTPQNP
jgi:hypothetical protein